MNGWLKGGMGLEESGKSYPWQSRQFIHITPGTSMLRTAKRPTAGAQEMRPKKTRGRFVQRLARTWGFAQYGGAHL